MNAKLYGRHVISDARICHGNPTFRGTRILVSDVLEQIADGLSWDTIVAEWKGKLSKDAIAEAAALSKRAFLDHVDEYVLERTAA